MKDREAENIIQNLSQKLFELRTDAGLSLEGLSHLTGLSISTISEMENLKSSPGSLTVVKICRALDIKPSKVFQDIDC